jgi:hypothetical protein
MTAAELLAQLTALGVSLAPDQDGKVQYVVQGRDIPPRLKALIRTYKGELLALLVTHTPAPPEPQGAPAPSPYRRWVTGGAPGAFATYTLAAPLYQTTRHAPVTYWGEACSKKTCTPSVSAAGHSLRFFPSDTCVSCWDRWDKQTKREEVPDDGSMDTV